MNFVEKSTVAFKHLYLMNWAPSFETLPYPPASGPYAVYTIPEFYDMVNYIQTRVILFFFVIVLSQRLTTFLCVYMLIELSLRLHE